MPEQLANNAISTLGSSINNSVTSLTVASGVTFPSVGIFRILIDSEIMKVTAVSGTTFTVVRAQEGTTAASHTGGAVVTHILTKTGLETFRSDYVLFDTLANRPTAGIAGRTFRASDFPCQYYDDGSVWTAYMPGQVLFNTPVNSGYSWTNQGSSTINMVGDNMIINSPTNGNATNYRPYTKSYTAPKKLTVAFVGGYQSSNAGGCGILVRNATSGKFSTLLIWGGAAAGNSFSIVSEHWNSVTSFNASIFVRNGTIALDSGLIWLQIEDNNTTVFMRISKDGYKWMLHTSFARTVFEAAGYNQWGPFLQPHDQEIDMRILSLKEE